MEKPNLLNINILSEDDEVFKNKLIDILKEEFAEEQTDFNINFDKKNYLEASQSVHKIKHKIGLLGMKNAFELSSSFESQLKKGEIELHPIFLGILNKIHVFLYENKQLK